jgi:hypothetical protein
MIETLLNSVVEKMDAHERKIDELSERLEQLKRNDQVLNVVESKVGAVKSLVEKFYFPKEEMWELSNHIATSVTLLKQPVKQEIVHHHHASKIIWTTAALFLTVCLISVGWYLTSEQVDIYKLNDTKYRFLKLHANESLNKSIGVLDSLSVANPKMRELVIAKEEQNKRDFEMMQRAAELEKEAKELKKKVRTKK